MFEVVQVRPLSRNGHGPLPEHYQVKDPNGRVMFSFPEKRTADRMCAGLNAAVRSAIDGSTLQLAKVSAAALGVLQKYPRVKVVDYRRAACQLALAVRPFADCV